MDGQCRGVAVGMLGDGGIVVRESLQTVGRYTVGPALGGGGFARVYRAHDPVLDRAVALKILHPHLIEDVETRERFVREGRALARIHHPNIVQIFDAGESDGVAYLAMELIDGESLATELRRRGRLTLAEVCEITDQVAAALQAVHDRDLLHLDVKPANVLIEAHSGRLVLLDLGVARGIEETLGAN